MTELGGNRFGDDPSGEPDAGPGREPAVDNEPTERIVADAVRRVDLRRTRQAELGTGPHPQAVRFATQVAQAVADVAAGREGEPDDAVPDGEAAGGDAVDVATEPRPFRALTLDERPFSGLGRLCGLGDLAGAPPVPPALRDAVFGANAAPVEEGHAAVALPAAPALVCDRAERIVRANAALLRLAGVTDGVELLGMRLSSLVVGADGDARLVRPDGGLVRVRIVRWDIPGHELSAAALVELGSGAPDSRADERRWIAELERIARVGTWTYDLATAKLRRSETLLELYRELGVDPEGPVEGDQVELLVRGLRSGARDGDHHVELQLPDGGVLSCRAEVESGPDGSPSRLVGVVRDVSTDRAAQRRVEHAGRRFADLMALVSGGVTLLDSTGRVVDANEGMCELLDIPLERLRGMTAAALTSDAGWATFGPDGQPDWLRAVPSGARYAYRVESVALRRGDSTTVWCELAVSRTSTDDGGWFWLVVCNDMSERLRAAEVLRSAATVDGLTRLPNRVACLELVDQMLAGPGRDRVAVVCGDLDDFARVNSSLGHEAGDDLLVELAARLQRDLPIGCTAARLSGDEFVVICADHAEVGGPDQLASLVADLLRTTVTVQGKPVPVTASVGLATPVPAGDVRAADLLRFAEAAMLDVKRRQRRGGIGMATDGVVSSATHALELEAELRAAIVGDGLVLDFQPVVGPDGTVVSAEALVRWPHPTRGVIPPADFLPLAQRSGLLRDLDRWVLRTAVREAAGWPEHRGRVPAVAVNLAGLLPGDADFQAVVAETVDEAGLPWERLVLELVETSLVALPPHALAAMAELTESGVRFAVDDFGTGYSSLARLKELPAQTVKVDRAFVTGIADDPADFAVARAVVDMARAMGRSTVAEGVETAEQFHVLRGIGVDAYQGWLFSRPVPAAQLRELLGGGRIATPATRPAL